MSRDFILEADRWIGFPRPLKELLQNNKDEVIFNLEKALSSGGTYQRKYAAFVLGQLGDEKHLEILQNCAATENVQGVREAMQAAIAGISIASTQKGKTEEERNQIIENVYDGKPAQI